MQSAHADDEHEDPREQLMFDPKPRGEMNAMVMESMHATNWKFWVVAIFLGILVATCLVWAWGYMIAEGLGVAGVNRPAYWGIFLVNTVFWIGISHAGTFISAILRSATPVHACSRTDDNFRPGASRFEHFHASGPRLALLLAVPLPKRAHDLAGLPFPTHVGLHGHQHLPIG